MPAFAAEFGMPVRVDLVSSAPRKTEKFYRELLNWNYTNADPAYGTQAAADMQGRRVATLQGMPVSVLLDANSADSTDFVDNQWRVNFHVDNVAAVCEKAASLGTEVLQEPIELIDGSLMAVIADPAGALVGLLQQPGEQTFFAAGEPGAPVWFELITANHDDFQKAMDFYHELFGWGMTVHTASEEGSYAVATEGGAPFAGIVGGRGTGTTVVEGDASFVGWLAYLGVENIDTAVNNAEQYGGKVLVPAQMTEFGPLATIQDPCGATTILCEVPLPPEEDQGEVDIFDNLDISQFQ
ncbi:VOC family protein [Corynebacterium sp. H78]|uniref:VOC family protein n=1 Tax=Corynebacterium sp. H78 TaxID=3133417 RepID=UPI0030A76291